jgi:hypothetical protein
MEILGALFVILWIVGQIVAKARNAAKEQGTPAQPPRGTPGSPGEAEDELRRFLESLSGGAPRPPQARPPAPAPATAPPPLPQAPQPALRTPVRKTPAAPAPQPHRIERTRPAPAPRRQPAAQRPVRPPMTTLREVVTAEPAAPPPLPEPRGVQQPAAAVDEAQLLRDGLSSALFGSRQARFGVARVGTGRGRRGNLLKGFKSRTGLRRAVIAREILGPPIALRKPGDAAPVR